MIALELPPETRPATPAPAAVRRRGPWTAIALILLAAGGIAVTVLMLYPGYINGDAKWQLDQARENHFNDWHPVLLSYIWRYLDKGIAGTGGLFLLTQFLFWPGAVAFLHGVLGSVRRVALGCVVLAAYLPIAISWGQIGKDAAMVSAMVALVGALTHAGRRKSPVALVAAFVAAILAVGSRHNALFALLPLMVWAAQILRDRYLPARLAGRLGSFRRLLIAAPVLAALVMGTHGLLVSRLIKPTPGFGGQAIFTFDLQGISVRTGENWYPRFMDHGQPPLQIAEIKQTYNNGDALTTLWNPPGTKGPGFVWSAAEYKTLFGQWLGTVVTHPGPYLDHRWHLFATLLNLDARGRWPYYLPPLDQVKAERSFNAPFKLRLFRAVLDGGDALVFQAWPYILGILVLMLVALLPGPRPPPVFWALASSALTYEAAYFVIAPGASFRYSLWAVAALPLMVAAAHLPARLRLLAGPGRRAALAVRRAATVVRRRFARTA